jgi:hypothetical protein
MLVCRPGISLACPVCTLLSPLPLRPLPVPVPAPAPVPATATATCGPVRYPRNLSTSPSSLIWHSCSSSYGSRSHQSHMSMQPALLPHPVSIYLSLPCLPASTESPCATRCLGLVLGSHLHTLNTHPVPILACSPCPLLSPLPPPALHSASPIRLLPSYDKTHSFITRHAILMCLISSSPSNESAQETANQSPSATKWICFPF